MARVSVNTPENADRRRKMAPVSVKMPQNADRERQERTGSTGSRDAHLREQGCHRGLVNISDLGEEFPNFFIKFVAR